MSLRVWLPLNGDLTNNGLSDLIFSVVNPSGGLSSATSGGKVVSGLFKRITKETADYIISNKNIILNGDVTMCCWAKVTGIGYSGTANGIFGQHGHMTGGLGITMKDVSSSDLRMSVNTGLYGDGHGSLSDRTYCTYYGSTNIYNAWHHLCLTYDSKTRQLRMYVDGKLETIEGYGSYITLNGNNIAARPVILFAWSTDHVSSPNYRPPCELNDVRIYDEVLSAKQIKEIAKGLVAHYPLKGMGSTNYLKGAGKYLANSPLIRQASVNVGNMGDAYVYYDLTDLCAVIPSDGTYTWVLEADGVPATHSPGNYAASSRHFCMWLQNTSTSSHYSWGSIGTGADGRHYGSITVPAGTYKIRINLYSNNGVDYIVKFWNMKIVKGSYNPNDIWCPHADDELYNFLGVDNSICTDASGYGNTLTKAGSIPMVGGSARYGSCVDFNQTGYLKKTDFNITTNEFTISFWLNPPTTTNAQHFICGTFNGWTSNGVGMWRDQGTDNGYSLLYRSGNESGHTGMPMFAPTHGAWSLFTLVYTGTQGILYKNGAEVGRVTGGSNGVVSHPVLYLGNSKYNEIASQTDEAMMSDFRFYATALSAADIAELYNTGASIANDGTLFAYDFKEAAVSQKSNIDKDGTVSTSGFNNKTVPTYEMRLKTLDDNSVWARIHHLDLNTDGTFFASAAEVAKSQKNNRYSRMGDVDKFKTGGVYEFMLTYPAKTAALPSGYTKLDYIEATGTQYLKTGVTGAARWEFDIQFTNTTIRQLMGYGGASDEYWGCQTDGKYGLFAGNTRGTAGDRDLIVHDGNSKLLWVENETLTSICTSDVSAKEYQIFAIGGDYLCRAKLYRCKCIKSGALIRDFIPARRNSDGYVGLYDIINNVFYGNSGSGNFTAGNVSSNQSIYLYNRWVQTSSPNATSVSGFYPVSTSWSAHNAGIRKHGSACIYNCDSGDTWYAPVGQLVVWEGGIPAADGSMQKETELWARIDKFSDATQTQIYNGAIVASDFVEI